MTQEDKKEAQRLKGVAEAKLSRITDFNKSQEIKLLCDEIKKTYDKVIKLYRKNDNN